jgi:cation-transporting ATPase E
MAIGSIPVLPPGWPTGLAEAEAVRRHVAGEGNVAAIHGSVGVGRILRRNLVTILNGSLTAVAAVLLFLGLHMEALMTCAPVFLNTAVGVIGELDAKRRLDRITLAARAAVAIVRDGGVGRRPPEAVVRGDIVLLERGDQVVVDGRIVAGAIEADESILTGEADPVPKATGDAVRSGTACLAGRAAMEVEAVGDATFASRLASEARGAADERTPLRRDLDAIIVALGILTMLTAVPVGLAMRGEGIDLLSPEGAKVAAVLVALVPQGLAIMITVTYAYAAIRISRAGAIVQRIDAVESMSRVDTLCLDKTGTITSGAVDLEDARILVRPDDSPAPEAVLAALGGMAAVDPGSTGRPDRTLAGIHARLPGPARPLRAEVPFASQRRWSAAVFEDEPDRAWILGAPGTVAPGDGPGDLDPSVADLVGADVAAGRRDLILAVADDPAIRDGEVPRLPDARRPVAVLRFRERIRPDAIATLGALRSAGLDLKLVSGDDPATVAGIAATVGIDPGRPWSGLELGDRDGGRLVATASEGRVFGRIGPDEKRRLVRGLRAAGRYVAMAGDGVNDVLALREANLGIAMESGSPAARAVAGLVLTGDRFEVLPRAVVEGQRVVAAMLATASVLVARTVSMVLVVLASALLGLPFPFTPRTNAVLALLTVGIPTLVLVLWIGPARTPRHIRWRVLGTAVPAGAAVAVAAVPAMLLAFDRLPLEEARTALTTLQVFAGIALLPILFPVVRDREGPFGRGGDLRPAGLALAMLAGFVAIAAFPASRELFELRPLPPVLVLLLALAAAAWMIAVIGLLRLGWPQRIVRRLLARAERDT